MKIQKIKIIAKPSLKVHPMEGQQRLITRRHRALLMVIQAGGCSSTILAEQMNLILSQSPGMTLMKTHVKVATNAVKPTSKRMIEPLPDLTIQFSSDSATTTRSSSIKRTTWITSTN